MALDDWSPDGRWLVYHQRGLPGAQTGLFVAGVAPGNSPRRLASCEGTADEARVSPNGAWLAFNCSESGRQEIYVVPFPEGGERVRGSRDGGVQPAWRGDSAELYFLSPDSVMMACGVEARDGFVASPPQAMFKTTLVATAQLVQYRVTADGQRFLWLLPVAATAQARVIITWRERFKTVQQPR